MAIKRPKPEEIVFASGAGVLKFLPMIDCCYSL